MFNVVVLPTFAFVDKEKLTRKYTGSSRKIFLGKDIVLKVEWKHDRDGLWQCQHENHLWRSLPKKHRNYFVPILMYKHTKEYDYVIQPRLKIKIFKGEKKKETGWNVIGDIVEKYRLDDIYPDLNCNWSFVNNSPIIFDYGV